VKQADPLARFWWYVEDMPNGCRLWRGGTAWGYGNFWVDGRTRRAHRWIWEQTVGPIPDGLVLDHLCGDRGCVEVRHLEVVTQTENMRRIHERGIGRGCPHGHDASEIAVKIFQGVLTRYCRACHRERARERRRAVGVEPKPGGAWGGQLADRDSCIRGHAIPENLTPNGKTCRLCRIELRKAGAQHVASADWIENT
jgi:hypothetical protein